MRSRLKKLVVGIVLSVAWMSRPVSADDLSLGLDIQLEVWTLPTKTAPTARYSAGTLVEGLPRHPSSTSWYVKVFKNPPTPFSANEIKAIAELLRDNDVPGLSLEGLKDIHDRDLDLFSEDLSLTWLNLHGTSITEQSLKSLRRLKSLRAIGVDKVLEPVIIPPLGTALGHPLSTIAAPVLSKNQNSPDVRERVTENGVRYLEFGTTAIDGSIARGTAWMDYSWMLYDLKGKPYPLSEHKGHTLFLYFWSDWGDGCAEEMGNIADLAKLLSPKGIVFLAISDQPVPRMKAFLAKHPTTLPVYQARSTPKNGPWTHGIPATYIIAPPGDIATIYFGERVWYSERIDGYLLQLEQEGRAQKE